MIRSSRSPFVSLAVAAALLCCCAPRITHRMIPNNQRRFSLAYDVRRSTGADTALSISLTLPEDAPPCGKFYFPVQVPGHYEILHFARYIRNFTAIDRAGDTLPAVLVDNELNNGADESALALRKIWETR